MSWTLFFQLMILVLWAAILTDMVMTGLQRRAATASAGLIKISRGEVGTDGE